MANPKDIISRLREDFDCRLTDEQIITIINTLEKRLALDIIRKTEIYKVNTNKHAVSYILQFYAKYIVHVYLNGREIYKISANNPIGYRADKKYLVLEMPYEQGVLQIEYIVVPEEFTTNNYGSKSLFLEDGYEEIYLYHILSREALMDNDIDRLNNFSLLYTEALNYLKSALFKSNGTSARYRNIW